MLLIRNILVAQVMGIILFHSFIPHLHHEEMTNEEHATTHKKANDIIDFLGLAFQGGSEDNLKNYTYAEQNFPTKTCMVYFHFPAGTNSILPEVIASNIRLYLRTQSQTSFDDIKTPSSGLRAPPVHDCYA